ncbi:MAG: hypothetical protein KGL54_10415 [Sphingomonadales bacterium]|nr:hypothetical protein [Sphingomonadales bacterium]
MRKPLPVIAAAVLSLWLAGCSEKTQDAASQAAKGAASDTATNLDKAGDAIGNAAHDVGKAASTAADDTADGLHRAGREVKDEARETRNEAREAATDARR